MIDLQFKLAGGILCLVVLISSFTSGAGGVLQLRDAEVDFSKMPECSSELCVPYAPSLHSTLGSSAPIVPSSLCPVI